MRPRRGGLELAEGARGCPREADAPLLHHCCTRLQHRGETEATLTVLMVLKVVPSGMRTRSRCCS